MQIEFYGAAGMVTGSCHIVRAGSKQILLDCGLIQGSSKQEQRNFESFPFDPKKIDAVVLSHAHIDHSGRLPLLVKRGFTGPIYAQNATRDLCKVLLEDSATLNERDAEYENRKRRSRGLEPIEPLYSRQDAIAALAYIEGLRYRQHQEILAGITICFRDAGHIMGSAIVELRIKADGVERRIVFSGDIGQYDSPILNDPVAIDHSDIVLMESTYGNRSHRDRELTIKEIGKIISSARQSHGNIIIPAFSIGRSQEILYTLGRHYEEWDVGRWHVFLDSPMAIEASEIYWNYPHLYDEEATRLRKNINEMPRLANLHLTKSTEESMVINKIKSGAIIIAGSGMCNGGRIVHHLKHNLTREQCHVIIVGYQANGSLGRRLVDGDTTVTIHRKEYPVRAKIHTVGGLSAHGDQNDLLRWVKGFKNQPPIYLVHGEPESAQGFANKVEGTLGNDVTVAQPGQTVDLTKLT